MEEIANVRQLPYSAEAEQAVLGSILADPTCLPQVIERVKVEDFHLPQNRDIYEVIYSMFNTGMAMMDEIVILETLARKEGVDKGRMATYLRQLIDITPTSSNIKEYIKIVKDKSTLRAIGQIAEDLLSTIHKTTGDEALELAEQRFSSMRQGFNGQGLTHVSAVMLEVYESLAKRAESDNAVPGLSTGLGELDRTISGLKEAELILLAARPGMGKTAMALNLLLYTGKFSQKSVAFFSLEMSREQLGLRLIASESFVDSKKLTTGKLSEQEWNQITAAAEALQATSIYIDDNPGATVADIKAKSRRLDNLGLIVVDYLQLMQSAGNKGFGGENRQQVVSDMSRNLKVMARELNVPVLCLSQLSRATENRDNKRPRLSDLRESGAIEQDADIVLFLYREDYYDQEGEHNNITECIVAKNRQGERGTVELQWIPQFTTFTSIDRKHTPP